ncbi:hypothetical protein [Leptodesmis sp.]|uniref:hypothetical protein n=1 Tax=Leptodesmis sp. TaxID=3100501 RepID=UPI0040535745
MPQLYLLLPLLLLVLISFSGGRSRHRSASPPAPPITSQAQPSIEPLTNTPLTGGSTNSSYANHSVPVADTTDEIPTPALLPGLLALGARILVKQGKEEQENS